MGQNFLIDFKQGGFITVFIGNFGIIAEYANHPQIRYIDTHSVPAKDLNIHVREDTKLILLAEGVPNSHYQWAMSHCRQHNIPWLLRRSPHAMRGSIENYFPLNGKPTVSQEEARETFVKGKLQPLIAFIDWSKSNHENATELLKKAAELNIKTTFGSLNQLVSNNRRKESRTAVPKSVRSKLDISVEMLDSMIKELEGMRDYLIEITEENRGLRAKVEKFKKALEE